MEETVRILEELFDKGFATRDLPILGDKLSATVRSLSGKDQLEIEFKMGKDKTKNSPAAYIINSYSLELLCKTVVSYGDKVFKDSEGTREFLENLTNSIIDKLVKAQNALEKDIRTALELDKIEENFSETGHLPEKSEQHPE